MLPAKSLKMHSFPNVTFLHYHNRAVTVSPTRAGPQTPREVVKSGTLLKGGDLRCPHITPWQAAGGAASPPGRPGSGPAAAPVTARRDRECRRVPELGTEGTQCRTWAVEVSIPIMPLTQLWGGFQPKIPANHR